MADDDRTGKFPDPLPFGVELWDGPGTKIPKGSIAMHLGPGRTAMAGLLREQPTLAPDEQIMLLRVGEVMKKVAVNTLRQTVLGSHGDRLVLEKPEPAIMSPHADGRTGLVVTATEEEKRAHAGVTPLLSDTQVRAEINQLIADPRHTHGSRLQEMHSIAKEGVDEHVIGLYRHVRTVCDAVADAVKTQRVISVDDLRADSKTSDALLGIQSDVLHLIRLMKSQQMVPQFKRHDTQDATHIVAESLNELVAAASMATTATFSAHQKDAYITLCHSVMDGLFKPREQGVDPRGLN